MVVQDHLLTVDDVWELAHHPDNENVYFELIDGKLFTMVPPGRRHGLLATEIAGYLWLFNSEHRLGEITIETGYHPSDTRYTLLGPDIAFLRHERLPQPPTEKYISVMPDLAVEILSPSDTIAKARRKAEVYLQNGTELVWLVQPKRQGVEVCRLVEGADLQFEFAGQGDSLSGEEILPGFELEVDLLFPSKDE